jgi:fructan beta-fructosidase
MRPADCCLLVLLALTASPTQAQDSTPARPDLVLADFEGTDYAGWTPDGTAFGDAPAQGTLDGQMTVDGFLGHGLVNSYNGGDGATGTLTSLPFRIERKHLNFLIGGGMNPDTARLELLIDGQPVRVATGPNDRPGGFERLGPGSWDVSEFEGRIAALRITDHAKGGWGHINVDHLVQSDTPTPGPSPHSRTLVASKPYLLVPIDSDAPSVRLTLLDAATGAPFRDLNARLAPNPKSASYWAELDLAPVAGRTLEARATLPEGHDGLNALTLSDSLPDAETPYAEPDRPHTHFTARRGWLNDPNGMVFHNGVYHLFFQHSPFDWHGNDKFWGHATSTDLVHWTEQPEALFNHAYGDWVWSGSAVVDRGNTSGWGRDGHDPLVLAYTSTARGECIAYSNDEGRTWTEFDGNPVVTHPREGRDPRLVRYEPGNHWVLAVYDESDDKVRGIQFYTSPDLKTWTYASRIEGFFECPDLFPIPLDGDPSQLVWVLYAADGKYVLGDFDGKTFTPRHEGKHTLWHGRFYAAQTFSNVPDYRRIQVGWAAGIDFPGMPFNQQMNIPVELSLRTTDDGPRLFARPVPELDALRTDTPIHWRGTLPDGSAPPLADRCPLPADIRLAFTPAPETRTVHLELRKVPIVYDVPGRTLKIGDHESMPLAPDASGRVSLRLLLDRRSVEAFGQNGAVALSAPVRPDSTTPTITLRADGAPTTVHDLQIYPLQSIWTPPANK